MSAKTYTAHCLDITALRGHQQFAHVDSSPLSSSHYGQWLVMDEWLYCLSDSYNTERNYYADQLKHLSSDYLIYHAANGQTGIAACLAQPIDCVVLEINLSDMSGFEVLQELVRNPASQAVAVIVFTHLTNPFILDLAVKNGALYGLCKSSTPADVLDKYILKAISANQDNRKPTPQEDAAPLLPFGFETFPSGEST